MPSNASSEQLGTLRQVVEQYCYDCGIDDEQERNYVAELVDALFNLGATDPNDLRRGLEDAIGPCRNRQASEIRAGAITYKEFAVNKPPARLILTR